MNHKNERQMIKVFTYDDRSDVYDDEDDEKFPYDDCSQKDFCDGWEAQFCPTLNDYYGIDDYDPMDL